MRGMDTSSRERRRNSGETKGRNHTLEPIRSTAGHVPFHALKMVMWLDRASKNLGLGEEERRSR